jgi:hypothetical protein
MNRKDFSSIESNTNNRIDSFDADPYEWSDLSQPERSVIGLKPISHQVGEIYELAPNEIRIKMLEHLLRSIGVLALVAVANGVFAKIRFRGGWPQLKIKSEDIAEVTVSDVISLADYVLQVNENIVFGLEKMLRGVQCIEDSEVASTFLANLAKNFRRRSSGKWDDVDPVLH